MRVRMGRDKLLQVRDFVLKHCKIVFPVVIVTAVAVTVAVALNLGRGRDAQGQGAEGEALSGGNETVVQTAAPEEIPMVVNEDPEIQSLVNAYYEAMVSGDRGAFLSLYDTVTENELLRYEETAKYLDHYTQIDVYTKPGPYEGSVIAYVEYRVCFVDHEEEFPGYENLFLCRNEEGALYIKNEANFTKEEREYISAINAQADVAEFNNRVNVAYNELLMENPDLLEYLSELGEQVNASIGVLLAEQNVSGGDQAEGGDTAQQPQEGQETQTPQPVQDTPAYATATTTVNVRSSDSEQADKLGKVTAGTRLSVQEVGVNGWTKVLYEGSTGYIKSEFLEFAESAAGQEVIGKVTASTNINVRAAASETAEKLGMLAGGESLDLLAVEGDWCKVVFGGQAAYVKAEFVQQQ